jgi:hypothetical protein
MAPGGSWDGDVIVYDEEMNPQDRLNAQVIAWALLPVISPLLVRGRADYLEGGILAARAHPDLQRFIASSDDSSHETQDEVQEEQHSIIPSPPPPPKLSFHPSRRKVEVSFSSTLRQLRAPGLFQKSNVVRVPHPSRCSVDILPGTLKVLLRVLLGTSSTPHLPLPPPSPSFHVHLRHHDHPSTALRKLDTKSAEAPRPTKTSRAHRALSHSRRSSFC